MGNRINPTILRLGYTKTWENSFVVINKSYAKLLYDIILYKAYIIYLLDHKNFYDIDLYYSHMNLFINKNKLEVHLFLYEVLDYMINIKNYFIRELFSKFFKLKQYLQTNDSKMLNVWLDFKGDFGRSLFFYSFYQFLAQSQNINNGKDSLTFGLGKDITEVLVGFNNDKSLYIVNNYLLKQNNKLSDFVSLELFLLNFIKLRKNIRDFQILGYSSLAELKLMTGKFKSWAEQYHHFDKLQLIDVNKGVLKYSLESKFLDRSQHGYLKFEHPEIKILERTYENEYLNGWSNKLYEHLSEGSPPRIMRFTKSNNVVDITEKRKKSKDFKLWKSNMFFNYNKFMLDMFGFNYGEDYDRVRIPGSSSLNISEYRSETVNGLFNNFLRSFDYKLENLGKVLRNFSDELDLDLVDIGNSTIFQTLVSGLFYRILKRENIKFEMTPNILEEYISWWDLKNLNKINRNKIINSLSFFFKPWQLSQGLKFKDLKFFSLGADQYRDNLNKINENYMEKNAINPLLYYFQESKRFLNWKVNNIFKKEQLIGDFNNYSDDSFEVVKSNLIKKFGVFKYNRNIGLHRDVVNIYFKNLRNINYGVQYMRNVLNKFFFENTINKELSGLGHFITKYRDMKEFLWNQYNDVKNLHVDFLRSYFFRKARLVKDSGFFDKTFKLNVWNKEAALPIKFGGIELFKKMCEFFYTKYKVNLRIVDKKLVVGFNVSDFEVEKLQNLHKKINSLDLISLLNFVVNNLSNFSMGALEFKDDLYKAILEFNSSFNRSALQKLYKLSNIVFVFKSLKSDETIVRKTYKVDKLELAEVMLDKLNELEVQTKKEELKACVEELVDVLPGVLMRLKGEIFDRSVISYCINLGNYFGRKLQQEVLANQEMGVEERLKIFKDNISKGYFFDAEKNTYYDDVVKLKDCIWDFDFGSQKFPKTDKNEPVKEGHWEWRLERTDLDYVVDERLKFTGAEKEKSLDISGLKLAQLLDVPGNVFYPGKRAFMGGVAKNWKLKRIALFSDDLEDFDIFKTELGVSLNKRRDYLWRDIIKDDLEGNLEKKNEEGYYITKDNHKQFFYYQYQNIKHRCEYLKTLPLRLQRYAKFVDNLESIAKKFMVSLDLEEIVESPYILQSKYKKQIDNIKDKFAGFRGRDLLDLVRLVELENEALQLFLEYKKETLYYNSNKVIAKIHKKAKTNIFVNKLLENLNLDFVGRSNYLHIGTKFVEEEEEEEEEKKEDNNGK